MVFSFSSLKKLTFRKKKKSDDLQHSWEKTSVPDDCGIYPPGHTRLVRVCILYSTLFCDAEATTNILHFRPSRVWFETSSMISIPCNQACYAPDVCYQEPAFSAAYVPLPIFGYPHQAEPSMNQLHGFCTTLMAEVCICWHFVAKECQLRGVFGNEPDTLETV